VEVLLVGAGIVFLILEFKAPDHVASGIVAVICFAIFFWLHFEHGGQLIFLAVALFVIGLALLGIEIFFVSGHGIAGVSGIVLVLAGLVLAGIEQWPATVDDWADAVKITVRHVLTMIGAAIVAVQLAKYLPEIPYVNRLVLLPPTENSEVDSPLPGSQAAEALLGEVGVATSPLRPSGIARIGERRVDVCTGWEFLDEGTPVQVVAVDGTRIVVKKV
jgi:membrane-bound ClpP family serine protease